MHQLCCFLFPYFCVPLRFALCVCVCVCLCVRVNKSSKHIYVCGTNSCLFTARHLVFGMGF